MNSLIEKVRVRLAHEVLDDRADSIDAVARPGLSVGSSNSLLHLWYE